MRSVPAPMLPGFSDFELVGTGGFSNVYRARQEALNRVVAVKVLLDPVHENAAALESQLAALGGISHPNIVTVLEAGVDSIRRPYIVTPFYPGGSLGDRIASQGPLDAEAVMRIGVKLCGAVATLHQQGILHCDIKPQNVLLDSFGDVVLADFGVARQIYGDDDAAVGITLHFAAPELLESGRVSAAADVFALGMTLYTLLMGRPADSMLSQTQLLARRLTGLPIALGTDIPAGLRDALARCLSSDPAERPSAQELGQLLQEVQRSSGLPVTPMPWRKGDRSMASTSPPSPIAPRHQSPEVTVLVPATIPRQSTLGPPDATLVRPPYELPSAPAWGNTGAPPPAAAAAAGNGGRGRGGRRPPGSSGAPWDGTGPLPTASAPAPRHSRWPLFRLLSGIGGVLIAVLLLPVTSIGRLLRSAAKGVRDAARHLLPRVSTANAPSTVHPTSALGMMIPDRPTAVDRLGQEPLVVGLGRLLDDPGTALPLTIGISGHWGAGKSSLMLQLAEYLTSSARPSESPTWFPVRFEAWRFQGREAVWVGLARAIYDQCQGERLGERVSFRVRLEVRRRGIARTLAAVLVLFIGIGLAVSVAGKQFAGNGHLIVNAGFAAAALSALTAAITYLGIVGQPFARALNRSGPARAFEDFLGVTHRAERDLDCLFRTITPTTRNRGIVVFLDDLDRCLPATITETLAAITEVFAKHDDRAVAFVLGVDLDIVASAVSNSLREITTELATIDPRRSGQLGEQYLEKIFQLSVSISGRSQFGLDRLLFGPQDAGSPVPAGRTGPAAPSSSVDVDLVSSWAARIAAADPSNPVDATLSGLFNTGPVSQEDRGAMQRALRGVRATLLSVSSSDVREAELRALRPLSLTPRAIKRFDNAFRLQLQVANSTPSSQLGYSLPEMTALAKWVAIRMFFPRLVRVLDREPGLLGELEDLASEQDNFNLVVRLQELLPATPPEVAAEAAGLLRSHTRESRITRLPLDSFLSTT